MKIIDLMVKIAKDELKLNTEFLWHYKMGDKKIKYIERYGAPMLAYRDERKPNDEHNAAYTGIFEKFNYTILDDEVEPIKDKPKKIKLLEINGNKIKVGNAWCSITKSNRKLAKQQNEIAKALNYLLEKGDKNE